MRMRRKHPQVKRMDEVAAEKALGILETGQKLRFFASFCPLSRFHSM